MPLFVGNLLQAGPAFADLRVDRCAFGDIYLAWMAMLASGLVGFFGCFMINVININKCVGLLVICVLLLAGCGKSSLIEGNGAFRIGDYASAESQWHELAEEGDADAQHNLGVLEFHRGNTAAAARWWQQAIAQEFVPSMLALARLEWMSGRRDAAVSHYLHAARWGNDRAASALEALGEPVPPADLRLAYVKRLEYRQERIARELNRPDRNESLNRMLDKYAYLLNENSD